MGQSVNQIRGQGQRTLLARFAGKVGCFLLGVGRAAECASHSGEQPGNARVDLECSRPAVQVVTEHIDRRTGTEMSKLCYTRTLSIDDCSQQAQRLSYAPVPRRFSGGGAL